MATTAKSVPNAGTNDGTNSGGTNTEPDQIQWLGWTPGPYDPQLQTTEEAGTGDVKD